MTWNNGRIEALTLTGRYATLVPLALAHQQDLALAVQDGELWKHWYTWIPAPEQMGAEIERRLDLQAKGSMCPFVVMVDGKAVGMTTFMNIDAPNRRLEIGSTWYAKSVQRSSINTECKLMLLTHAFEQLDCIAVEFRTHWVNHQSRRAIERLGAKLDGVLRNHAINQHFMAKGTLRDTCVYSIISGEWSNVKAHLSYRLDCIYS